jgi:hypothetical protein
LQRLAVQAGIEQSGYFHIGPYLNSAEDRTKFDRGDRAHEKFLGWIERSVRVMPLYLTGDSGSGKSSLLNAFVVPALRDRGWTVVEARAWQDPETALRNALSQLSRTLRSRQGESQELRHLLATAVRAAGAPANWIGFVSGSQIADMLGMNALLRLIAASGTSKRSSSGLKAISIFSVA